MSTLRCPECGFKVHPNDAVCRQCGYRFRMDRFERILPFLRRPERQWENRLSLRQRLWAILVLPSVAFWDIVREPDTRGPVLIFFGNIFVISFFYIMMMVHVVGNSLYSLLFGWLGILPIFLLLYFLWTLIYYGFVHLIVNLAGEEGYFAETFLLSQYSSLPFLIANTISLPLLLLIPPPIGLSFVSITNLGALLFSPVWFIVWGLSVAGYLWGAVLLAMGLRERYHFSTEKALLITLSVTLFVVVVGFIARITIGIIT
ncbi:MAG: YIP1 family protein [Promethearchaeota archaeon]